MMDRSLARRRPISDLFLFVTFLSPKNVSVSFWVNLTSPSGVTWALKKNAKRPRWRRDPNKATSRCLHAEQQRYKRVSSFHLGAPVTSVTGICGRCRPKFKLLRSCAKSLGRKLALPHRRADVWENKLAGEGFSGTCSLHAGIGDITRESEIGGFSRGLRGEVLHSAVNFFNDRM